MGVDASARLRGAFWHVFPRIDPILFCFRVRSARQCRSPCQKDVLSIVSKALDCQSMKPIPLIIDNGLFVNMAARMAQDTEVAYYSSWQAAFPQSRELAPGSGLKNVLRVDEPIGFMLEGRTSYVIVPDLFLDGYEKLAKAMEIPCFATNGGSLLETDRWELKKYLESKGLPVNESWEVEGLDELRKILEKRKDLYVKVSAFRGDMETFHHVDWTSTEPEFYRWKVKFGPFGEKVRFIAETSIDDAVEVGIDTFFRNGEWVYPCFFGPEIKDGGYAGVMLDNTPKLYRPTMDALAEYFRQTDYSCFFSNEMRVRGKEVFMTDATCRVPSPPGGVLMASMSNFTDFLLKGIEPDYAGKVICEIVLKSDIVTDTWMRVQVPKELRHALMLHNYCEIDGKIWVIPHESKYKEFGSACGWGATLDEAREMAKEVASETKADGLFYDEHVLDKAEEELKKAL